MTTAKASKTIKVILATMGVAAGIGLGLLGGKTISGADTMLDQNIDYQRKQECVQIRDNISSAESELDYRSSYTTFMYIRSGKSLLTIPIYHPAEYPNPKYSIDKLDDALELYSTNVQNQHDLPGLDARLEVIQSTLPSELDLRMYDGKDVNDSTFQEERIALNQEEDAVKQVIINYDSKVPASLKDMRNKGIIELASGAIVGLVSAGMISNWLVNDDYY